MKANNPIDPATGLPLDKSYFECGLPPLPAGISRCYEGDLQASINIAEVEQIISAEQAWYLREKYLRMERT